MGLSWTWPIVLSHRNSFFGDFIFLSIIRRPPSIFEINRTKCLILVIIGLHILHNHLSLALLGSAWPSLAQLGPAWPSLAQLGPAIIQMAWNCCYTYEINRICFIMNHFLLSVTFVQNLLDDFINITQKELAEKYFSPFNLNFLFLTFCCLFWWNGPWPCPRVIGAWQ